MTHANFDTTHAPQGPRWRATTKLIVVVILLVLFGLSVYLFRIIWGPLIVGAIMAFVLYPVVHSLSRLMRMPPGIATTLVYMVLMALIIPVALILVPLLVDQILVAQRQLIELIQDLSEISADTIDVMGFTFVVGDVVRQITSDLIALITTMATSSVSVVMGAARTGFLVVFTVVIGYYLTRDAPKVVDWLIGLSPPVYRPDLVHLLSEINQVWSAYFRGQVVLSLTVAFILGTVSAILGLPQPLLMGLWGGLLEFVPSIGHTVWGATAVIMALLKGSSYLPLPTLAFALVVLGAYLAFTQLDMNVLIPNIIGGHMRLHPVVVLIGIIVGIEVGGVIGVALAAPTIASLRVVGWYMYARLFDLDPFPPEADST